MIAQTGTFAKWRPSRRQVSADRPSPGKSWLAEDRSCGPGGARPDRRRHRSFESSITAPAAVGDERGASPGGERRTAVARGGRMRYKDESGRRTGGRSPLFPSEEP
jgi:hypothetical protein